MAAAAPDDDGDCHPETQKAPHYCCLLTPLPRQMAAAAWPRRYCHHDGDDGDGTLALKMTTKHGVLCVPRHRSDDEDVMAGHLLVDGLEAGEWVGRLVVGVWDLMVRLVGLHGSLWI